MSIQSRRTQDNERQKKDSKSLALFHYLLNFYIFYYLCASLFIHFSSMIDR